MLSVSWSGNPAHPLPSKNMLQYHNTAKTIYGDKFLTLVYAFLCRAASFQSSSEIFLMLFAFGTDVEIRGKDATERYKNRGTKKTPSVHDVNRIAIKYSSIFRFFFSF